MYSVCCNGGALRACLALERYSVAAYARWHEQDVAERHLRRLAARAKVALKTYSVRLDVPTIPPSGSQFQATREVARIRDLTGSIRPC